MDMLCLSFPPCGNGSLISGMEQNEDGHVRKKYSTCSQEFSNGVVRMIRSLGYLGYHNAD